MCTTQTSDCTFVHHTSVTPNYYLPHTRFFPTQSSSVPPSLFLYHSFLPPSPFLIPPLTDVSEESSLIRSTVMKSPLVETSAREILPSGSFAARAISERSVRAPSLSCPLV